jgi:beta-lactamase regulating signal transducer with metallopeptidase domain
MPAVVPWEWRGDQQMGTRRVAVRPVERIEVPATSPPEFAVTTAREDLTPAVKISKRLEPARPVTVEKPAAPARSWWDAARRYLVGVWLAGVVLLGARVAWSSVRLGRAVRRMAVIGEGPVRELLRACCDEFRIRRAPELRELPGAGAPALVGFWRPRVLLPAQVLGRLGEDELRLILMHELAHVKRRDVLLNWAATLVAVVHWLNPAAWLVVWRMRVEREMACDEMVLRAGRGEAYGRTIVRLAEALSASGVSAVAVARVAPPAGAVGILEGRAQLQRRLLMIARYDAKRRRGPVVAMGLAMVIGGAALTGVTRAGDERSKSPTTDKPKTTVERGAAFAPGAPGAGGLPGRPGGPSEPALTPPADYGPAARGVPAGAPGRPPAGAAANPTAAMGGIPGAAAGAVTRSPEEEKANAQTAELLKRPIADIKFEGQALSDVVDYFRDVTKVDILVEWPALEQMGVTRDAPVTLRLREPTPADAVLTLMFRAMGDDLRYEIDKGVVVIGPSSKRPAVVVRVYDVGELLSNDAAAPSGPTGSPGWTAEAADAAALTHLIQATVEPDAWQEGGGPGTITVFKNKLVVKASESVHKEIASLLEMLRDKPTTRGKETGGVTPTVEKNEHRAP